METAIHTDGRHNSMHELTPHPENNCSVNYYLGVGLIRTITYSHWRVRKLCAH